MIGKIGNAFFSTLLNTYSFKICDSVKMAVDSPDIASKFFLKWKPLQNTDILPKSHSC